jgi:hypothetical protein
MLTPTHAHAQHYFVLTDTKLFYAEAQDDEGEDEEEDDSDGKVH